MNASPTGGARRAAAAVAPSRIAEWVAHAVALAVFGALGFDFGNRLAGPLLGVLAAANTGFFAWLYVGTVFDWWARRRQR